MYVKRFRSLSSRTKKTPDIKKFVKICAMNVGLVACFLNDAQCYTFEQLYRRVLIYEELNRFSASTKNNGASSNAVTKLSHMDHE